MPSAIAAQIVQPVRQSPALYQVQGSPRAVEVLQLIIDVFVDTRRQMLSGAAAGKEIGRHRKRLASIYKKLEEFSEVILDVEINKRDRTTVREEAEVLTTSVLDAVKAHLADKQVRNEEVIAEIHRKMAEADKLRAEARKVHAEADALDIKNLRDRFELMKSITATLAENDPQPLLFLNVMKELDALATEVADTIQSDLDALTKKNRNS